MVTHTTVGLSENNNKAEKTGGWSSCCFELLLWSLHLIT